MQKTAIQEGRCYRRGPVVRRVERIYHDGEGTARVEYTRFAGRGSRLHDTPLLTTFAQWALGIEPLAAEQAAS